MEQKENDKILAFDSLFTTNQIQIFKIMLSYMNPSLQKNLAIYIKLMELQYTLSFFQKYPHAAASQCVTETSLNSGRFYDEILPFCDHSQRKKIKQLKQTMQSLESMQEMMAMLEMMKELFPQGSGTQDDTAGTGDTRDSGTGDNYTGADSSDGPGGIGCFRGSGFGNIDITQLLSMLSGGNMPDLSGMSDIINLFNNSQTSSNTEH